VAVKNYLFKSARAIINVFICCTAVVGTRLKVGKTHKSQPATSSGLKQKRPRKHDALVAFVLLVGTAVCQQKVTQGLYPAPTTGSSPNLTSAINGGAKLLVFECGWNQIESNTTPGSYSWTACDSQATAILAAYPSALIEIVLAPASDVSPNVDTPDYVLNTTGQYTAFCASSQYGGQSQCVGGSNMSRVCTTNANCPGSTCAAPPASGVVNASTNHSGIPVMWNAEAETRWNAFITAALAHFPYASYHANLYGLVFGYQKGGENFPECSAQQQTLVSPATTAQLISTWVGMNQSQDATILAAETAPYQVNGVWILGNDNCVGNTRTPSGGNNCNLADLEAASHAANHIGQRSTCINISDQTNYLTGQPTCGDIFNIFQQYTGPKDIQEGGESSPTGQQGTGQHACLINGSWTQLLPFVQQHWGPGSGPFIHEGLQDDWYGTFASGYTTDPCWPRTGTGATSTPWTPYVNVLTNMVNGLPAGTSNMQGASNMLGASSLDNQRAVGPPGYLGARKDDLAVEVVAAPNVGGLVNNGTLVTDTMVAGAKMFRLTDTTTQTGGNNNFTYSVCCGGSADNVVSSMLDTFALGVDTGSNTFPLYVDQVNHKGVPLYSNFFSTNKGGITVNAGEFSATNDMWFHDHGSTNQPQVQRIDFTGYNSPSITAPSALPVFTEEADFSVVLGNYNLCSGAATGTVNVSATGAVSWVSGTKFNVGNDPYVVINGSNYNATWNSTTTATITYSGPALTGVTYTKAEPSCWQTLGGMNSLDNQNSPQFVIAQAYSKTGGQGSGCEALYAVLNGQNPVLTGNQYWEYNSCTGQVNEWLYSGGSWSPTSIGTVAIDDRFCLHNEKYHGGNAITLTSTTSGVCSTVVTGNGATYYFWIKGTATVIPCLMCTGHETEEVAAFIGACDPSGQGDNFCLIYYTQAGAGIVNTTGGTCPAACQVNFVSGIPFQTIWLSKIAVNGTAYTISSCPTINQCLLTTSPGAQTGVRYNFPVTVTQGGGTPGGLQLINYPKLWSWPTCSGSSFPFNNQPCSKSPLDTHISSAQNAILQNDTGLNIYSSTSFNNSSFPRGPGNANVSSGIVTLNYGTAFVASEVGHNRIINGTNCLVSAWTSSTQETVSGCSLGTLSNAWTYITIYPGGGYDEIMGFAASPKFQFPAPGYNYREAYGYNTTLNQAFGTQNMITAGSQTGKLTFISSDWQCTLGTTTGANPGFCPPDWAQSTALAASAYIWPQSNNNGGYVYQQAASSCATSGTEPNPFNQTPGGTQSDGTCVYTNVGTFRGDIFVLYNP
jgi:hypothetical protein